VVDKLNPLDRYLFLYFITNERTNLSGVYEVPLRTISNETGIEKEEIVRMMERLRGKVEYKDGWVCLVNFTKHQNMKNGSIVKGIENKLNELPESIKLWVSELRNTHHSYTTGIPLVHEPYTSPDKGIELKGIKRKGKEENTAPTKTAEDSFFSTLEDNLVPTAGLPLEEVRKFHRYWGEKNRKGKMKWELQKTFELTRRMATWRERAFGITNQQEETIHL
jgi:hypothetical protein